VTMWFVCEPPLGRIRTTRPPMSITVVDDRGGHIRASETRISGLAKFFKAARKMERDHLDRRVLSDNLSASDNAVFSSVS
jgi:hypothetical protein